MAAKRFVLNHLCVVEWSQLASYAMAFPSIIEWVLINFSYCSPNFLILDEPTNHLDVETVEALGKVLTQFNVSS